MGLRVWLEHPGLTRFSCGQCQTFVYDLEKGERKTFRSGPDRVETPIPQRLAPCFAGFQCGKGTPENEKWTVLSERNQRCYAAYRQARAVNFMGIDMDDLTRDNFAIIDQIVRAHEQSVAAKAIGLETAKVLAIALGGR